ncbi:MAG: glycosyltransferase family 4 protein [Candidatus Krumholzibacteria bacterium]|nr:glycosyltransferase family 4 protein [Candidatus Krumholzibacteria bacterium]
MKQKRVLLIGPFPPPIGGDTIPTLNILRSEYWSRSGIEVEHVNTSAGDRVRVADEKHSVADVLRGIRIMIRVMRKLPRVRLVLLLANCRFICTMGLPVILLSRVMRKPIVIKPFGAMLGERIGAMEPLRKSLTMSLLNRAAFIFPQTRRLAEELVNDAGMDAARVVHFPNFLPDEAFRPEYRKKRFAGACVFVGQIKREKGVFDIIEALRGQEGITCDFFGPIVDRDHDAFVTALSGDGNCAYRGIVEPDSVVETIGAYDVLLLPSYHPGEGYPAVILQAFAAGVPVIASSWKDIPEMVEDGSTGILVPARAPARIREALRRIAVDGDLYESMAAKAFAVSRDFSEKAIVNDILITRVSGLLPS